MRVRLPINPISVLWLAVPAAIVLNLTGCANPFRENYESSLERWPHGEVSRLLPPEGEVRILTSQDIRRDALRMMEDGYLLLGRARFRGAAVDPKIARRQAREVGASVVMIEAKYAQSLTETVPVSEWIPEREVKYTETTVVESGPNAGQIVEREVTRTVEGEFKTSYVPQTVDYYDYAATFWGKAKPPILGVLVQDPSEETRQRLQTNRGVEIRAVIRNSPAYRADLLRGDVITSIAGQEVFDRNQFFDLVVAHQGQEVAVELNRNGETKRLKIQLETD